MKLEGYDFSITLEDSPPDICTRVVRSGEGISELLL